VHLTLYQHIISLHYFKVISITVLAPSDFSALKTFVRKPVHENRSKFFQWFKITSKRHPKLKTIAELKEVLQVIWDSLPQGPIDNVKEFSKWLKACVAAEGGHFEHSQ